MTTNLSDYFRQQRMRLGLRLGDVARLLSHRSIAGTASKIMVFEEKGDIPSELVLKLAAALGIDETTIQRLIEQDRREFVERWNKWAEEPVEPHLVVRVIPGAYFEQEIDKDVRRRAAMEEYASDYARRMRRKTWLILNRRRTIYFDENGKKQVQEAVPGGLNTPYMQLGGSSQKFLLTPSMGMRPLDEPEWHGPK